MKMTNQAERTEEEIYQYFLQEEGLWEKSVANYSRKELLEVFPEVKQIISQKIMEWEEIQNVLSDGIKEKLLLIRREADSETSRWFWRTWIKYTDGAKLVEINRQLSRLKGLLAIAKGYKSSKRSVEDQIQTARAVPIQSLIEFPLRQSGKSLIGLCPFHKDRHPSFNIYPETNSFWCFGCQQGGDSINFVRLTYGYSFREAVLFLTRK